MTEISFDNLGSAVYRASMNREGSNPHLSPKAKRWLTENRAAIEHWNAWTKEHGLPLARYRDEVWAEFPKP